MLGACLLGKRDIVTQYRELLPGNPFYVPKHADMWRVICALDDAGIAPDPVSVADRAPSIYARWVDPDDRLYVTELYAQAPLVANPAHARTVAAHAAVRDVIAAGMRLQQMGGGADLDDVEQLLERVRADLAAVTVARPQRQPWHDQLVDGAAFALDIPRDIPAVWGDDQGRVMWAQGEALMLVGPPGVGKSTVGGQLVAARLGLLREVLGLPVQAGQRRLLYIAADRPSQIARSLRRTLDRDGWHNVVREKVIVWRGPPPGDFGAKPDLLLAMARDADADTVVVDSLKDVCSGLTEDIPAAGYQRARNLLLREGVELLELHHLTKYGPNGVAPTELQNVYGNQQIIGGAGSVVLLWGKAGDIQVRLTHLKPVQEVVGPWTVIHDHSVGMSTVEKGPDLVRLAAAAPAGLTVPDAAKQLFFTAKPSKNEIERARRALQQLVKKGRLLEGRGRADDPKTVTYYAAAQEEDERG